MLPRLLLLACSHPKHAGRNCRSAGKTLTQDTSARLAFQHRRRLLGHRNVGETRQRYQLGWEMMIRGVRARAVMRLYGPRLITVSSKQPRPCRLTPPIPANPNRRGQIEMRPRFPPVGWPAAPAAPSVRSPIAEKAMAPLRRFSVSSHLVDQRWHPSGKRRVRCKRTLCSGRPHWHEQVEIVHALAAVTKCRLRHRSHRLLRRRCGLEPASSKPLAGHGHAKITDLAYGLSSERLTRDSLRRQRLPRQIRAEGLTPFQWSSAVFHQSFRYTGPKYFPATKRVGDLDAHPPEPLHEHNHLPTSFIISPRREPRSGPAVHRAPLSSR
jgi:hypothetical protein